MSTELVLSRYPSPRNHD